MSASCKILIAPDSFKGSICAAEAAQAIARGLLKTEQGRCAELLQCPIADGGEGTLEALVAPQQRISLTVTATGGAQITAEYGHIGKTAIIEMARAAGLTLVPEDKRSALSATTFGVGEMIRDALDRGFDEIMLTVGGSGSNDGGCGMMAALGMRFLDAQGNAFVPMGGTLHKIASIDAGALDARLQSTRLTVATDVKNPLLGQDGATFVYARQKGCADSDLPAMERGMTHYAAQLQALSGNDVAHIPGCGAGGGIAAPLLAFCKASIRSGIDAVLEAAGFDKLLQGARAVITGEGKIDRQSLFGKAISGVCKAAAAAGVPVYALVGCIGDDKNTLLRMGLTDIVAIGDLAPDVAYSMTHADELLEKAAATLQL